MSKVLDAIMSRRSDRHFAKRTVEPEVIDALVEAFRWGPSSNNRQPWRLLFAEGPDAVRAYDAALSKNNQSWAMAAPVKMVVIGNQEEQPDRNGLQSFMLDCGLALENMLIQGYAMGLTIHAMAGWDYAKVREGFQIPDPFHPVALVAAGYRGRVEDLPEEVRVKDERPRTRKSPEEMSFRDRFGNGRPAGATK
jgi:nitroreductase